MAETLNGSSAAYDPHIGHDAFREGFGEDLLRVLDLATWGIGPDLGAIYRRVEEEVRYAVDQESALCGFISREILPRLRDYPGAPRGAGVYSASLADLERIHRGLLFNGGVEACDSTIQSHDTLPLTIFQIGVCLVSYAGDQGTWVQRLFRRDLRASSDHTEQLLLDLLERRERRGGLNRPDRDDLSQLARRGIMAYAERAILLREARAAWRLGHGSPAPFELLTGSGSNDLMVEATKIIRELVEQRQTFVFVASEPRDRLLLSLGQALPPLHYAIVRTLRDQIDAILDRHTFWTGLSVDTHWDGVRLSLQEWMRRFRDVVGPQVVMGVFRASRLSPPQVFYAHVNHADLAAHIALADSILQEHRGFPLLIDLADAVCSGLFGRDSLQAPVTNAYTAVGAPWRFLSERASRSMV